MFLAFWDCPCPGKSNAYNEKLSARFLSENCLYQNSDEMEAPCINIIAGFFESPACCTNILQDSISIKVLLIIKKIEVLTIKLLCNINIIPNPGNSFFQEGATDQSSRLKKFSHPRNSFYICRINNQHLIMMKE